MRERERETTLSSMIFSNVSNVKIRMQYVMRHSMRLRHYMNDHGVACKLSLFDVARDLVLALKVLNLMR